MSFGEDEEILQDFLVEAGEILDQLSEQLVELEQRPDDKNLLNAIFRGFHTVKGGAGFLQLNNMVTCCHLTENLFDILRNGKRPVTSELMDVVLQALDTINAQFDDVQHRREPKDPPQLLVDRLERLVSCADLAEAASSTLENIIATSSGDMAQAPAVAVSDSRLSLTDEEYQSYIDAIADKPHQVPAPTDSKPALSNDEISEDEFEHLLDQLHGKGAAPSAASLNAAALSRSVAEGQAESSKKIEAPKKTEVPKKAAAVTVKDTSSDEISEDEFEALLDQLHGSGKGPTASIKTTAINEKTTAINEKTTATNEKTTAISEKTTAPVQPAAPSSDLISDSEFEDLLDQLHGVGKGPTVTAAVDKTAIHSEPVQPKSIAAKESSAKPVLANVTPISRAVPEVPQPQEAAASTAVAAETTVRVDTQRLDDIMNMVGELVLVRNRLVRLGTDSSNEALSKAVANLDVVTADLQTAVMKTRMQPIKKVFGRFPRVVRDLARNLKKEINLELVGEETDLDKNLVEALADPLVHLVRNSVDHGIELPAVREQKGKPRIGLVTLAAEQEGDHILLSITDDGGGMDPMLLRSKAVEKGIMDSDAAARLSDIEAFNLIFAPGFSTKTEISDVSGRGVGMDVVKTKISQLNGSIEIKSVLGEGTRIAIKVPLTLAIMPTLMIMLDKQTFALPLMNVNEIFHMDLRRTHVVDGQECVTIRDKAIPIFHLKRWLVKRPMLVDKPQEGHVVIVSVGARRVGFIVDQLIGQEEVVIKPLGRMLQGTPGMSGATITGDGTIALILDVPSMLTKYVGAI
ncbi:MAG: chemotaxis protein CheA [Marinagarivorans sp.]|nr:chemotaxis protein CheA [Marinagarivorans sp.]